MKKVIYVQTAMALVGPLTEIFHEYFPEVQVEHIAESSLIKEVIANNAVTPAVCRRLLDYYNAAADSGADVIFNTCSSVGDVADLGNKIARVYLPRSILRAVCSLPVPRRLEPKWNWLKVLPMEHLQLDKAVTVLPTTVSLPRLLLASRIRWICSFWLRAPWHAWSSACQNLLESLFFHRQYLE